MGARIAPEPSSALFMVLQLADARSSTLLWHPGVVDIGLGPNLSFGYRVYAFICAGDDGGDAWYIGSVPVGDLERRMRDHAGARGSDFTGVFPARGLMILWPAKDAEVAELAVWAAILKSVPAAARFRVGGSLQTQARPSPLMRLWVDEVRAHVSGGCYRCGDTGARHWAHKCKERARAVEYRCGACSAAVNILGGGRSVTVEAKVADCRKPLCRIDAAPRQSGSGKSEASPVAPAAADPVVADPVVADPVIPALPPQTKREPAPRMPRRRASNRCAGFVVRHKGKALSLLAWHLGREAHPAERRRAATCCSRGAYKVVGGTARSLVSQGFAGTAPPPFRPFGAVSLVARDDSMGEPGLRDVLLPLSLLEKHFPDPG